MKKMFSSIAVIIPLIFILSACKPTMESVYESVSSTPLPSPAYTDAPTIEPTPTPFTELTFEEIRNKLEKITGEETVFDKEGLMGFEEYLFISECGRYLVDRKTGDIRLFTSTISKDNPEQLINEEEAKDLAITMLSKYCPEFFEYDYMLETHNHHETEYGFYFYQLSPKGRHTGNHVNAMIIYDGTLEAFSIFYDEDPLAVDADYMVSESEAIEIAYNAAKERISITDKDGKEAEIFFDEREKHELEIYMQYFKGIQRWMIEVQNIKTSMPKDNSGGYPIIGFSSVINANTGEIIGFSEYRAFSKSDEQ